MGQSSSSGETNQGIPALFSGLQEDIHRQASTLCQVATLTYEQFIRDIEQLNKTLSSDVFTDANGKRILFAIKKGSDSTVLWKGTVRICCVKLDCETGKIESKRLLNLRQFLQVKKTIVYQTTETSTENVSSACNFSASMILDKVESMPYDMDECCICMERKPQVILPCAHNYCLPCIEQWNVTNKTCPICRESLETTNESWVISEKPDSTEMADELRRSLIGLAEETRLPQR